jgi:uncharacterized protein (DUF302 family)
MHKQLIFFVLAVSLVVGTAIADTGMVSVKSTHSVTDTLDRLETLLKEKGMTVFARINHTAGAEKVGLALRPTEQVIFGNPKVGTPFIQCKQTVAIDLPQKALAWEDENGQVWLSYNDPQYIAQRHEAEDCGEVIDKLSKALGNFAAAATEP